MRLESPNLTYNCSVMSPGNPFIMLVSLCQGLRQQTTKKQCRRGSLHSCECWLILVGMTVHPDTYTSRFKVKVKVKVIDQSYGAQEETTAQQLLG